MDLAIQNFRGIRKVNPVVDVVSGAVLSAVTCRNTELRYTEKGNNVGIFTAAGNQIVSACPNKIIGQWEEEFWNEVVCRCLNKGYLVIYELPVPNGIHKNNEKIEYFSYSWGYFQTHFIHITDLAQLTSVLSNLDDLIIEEKYKEEQQKKEK